MAFERWLALVHGDAAYANLWVTTPLAVYLTHPGCAECNRWFGRSRPNFKPLELGRIDVDSADFWTSRLLSSSSRSRAEEAASNLSRTLTLTSI